MSLTDEEILVCIASDDKGAFRVLYDRYKDKVYNTCISYVQNKSDAEEITQDVFTQIYKKAYSFKHKSAVSTWIYRIAINLSINKINKNKRARFTESIELINDPKDFNHPGVLLENKENAQILFAAITTLVESQQTAFILSYIEQQPRQEVAEIMNTTLKSVESLLSRAKKNLRDKLSDSYPNRRK